MITRERLLELTSWEPTAATTSKPSCSREEWKEMARELLATRWRPITAEDLPKYRDEVGRIRASQALRQEWEVQAVKCTKGWIHWADSGWTHFRPINPPERKEQP